LSPLADNDQMKLTTKTISDFKKELGEKIYAKGINEVVKESGVSQRTVYRVLDTNYSPSLVVTLNLCRSVGLTLLVDKPTEKNSLSNIIKV